MHLAYFDENKYSKDNPFFFIGGYLVPEAQAQELEQTLAQIQSNFFGSTALLKKHEFHGVHMLHGKENFNGRKLTERVELFQNLATFVINNQLPIRMVCVDVETHQQKHDYPEPEYQLGLMLALKQFCKYMEEKSEIGVIFGDYEEQEISHAVLDIGEFKRKGGAVGGDRPLIQLVDTVYFTHSHHSRFIQLADVLVYMAGRYENMKTPPSKWHEKEVFGLWQKIKASTDFSIQCWP